MASDEESRQRAARIAALNNAFRTTGQGGTVLATRGIIAKGETFVALALAQVRAFATFTADNDPYGEHDFGAFTLLGARVYWKIDPCAAYF